MGLSAYLYLQSLSRIVGQRERYRFRLVELLVFTTANALLSGVGSIGDAVVFVIFAVYMIVAGPLWCRFVSARVRSRPAVFCLTSVAIVSSFVAVLTVLSSLVCIFGPWTGAELSMANGLFPRTAFLALYPGVIFAWACVLGDNFQEGNDLIVYGLPFGIMFNVVVGAFVGAVLGLLADSQRVDSYADENSLSDVAKRS